MFENRRVRLLSLTITILILAVSVRSWHESVVQQNTPSATQKLEAIVESSPTCNVPCWQGLTPGVSTEEEFLALANSEYADSRFQDLRKNEQPVTYYFWHDRLMELPIEIRISQEGTISFISFVPDFTFEKIVERLGYPNAYEAAGFSDLSYYVTAKFFYESESLVVWMNTNELKPYSDPCKILAYKDMPVRAIYITHSGSVDEMIETVDQFFDPRIQKVRPWPDTNLLELQPCS